MMTLIATTGIGQVRTVFFAGGQVSSAHYVIRDSKQPADRKRGLMGGMALKVPFDNQLYFFPSVFYSRKGYKVKLEQPSFPPSELAVNNETELQTVEIAPLLQLDLSKKENHLFLRFGPSIDIAFSGREKFDTLNSTGGFGTVDRPMKFAFTEYGRFTAQANLHLGYETKKGLLFFAFYQHGLGSLNNADNGPRILHRIAGLSIGWFFQRHNPLVMDTSPIR